jgi:hypothetical protein
MSIKFVGVAFLLTSAVIAPINNHYFGLPPPLDHSPENTSSHNFDIVSNAGHQHISNPNSTWAHMVFTYILTGLAVYFLLAETRKIIKIRQDYLGSQCTITDRTIRLSGIPKDLRSEEKLTQIIEKLEIGKVESVTLCRDWKYLDGLMDQRASVLRKLEEAWSVYLGKMSVNLDVMSPPDAQHSIDDHVDDIRQEDDGLLSETENQNTNYDKPRPKIRIWYGFLKFQSRKVDAINYYEEHLRKFDEKIVDAREKEYIPSSLAFITMDSIPACQMAVQALIDPEPMQLLATLAPAPSDIIWKNTYLPRWRRMTRAWSLSIFISFLTVIWLVPVASVASLLNVCTIQKVWPGFATILSRHEIVKALVQTGLPTLAVSLLNIAVPYLYDYLSNKQGSISQSEVELSVISKNFAFTFFNVFFVFTVFGTATNIWPTLQKSLKDTTQIAYTIAKALKDLGNFYTSFILLQGVGLFPLRLLDFGSVALYPIMRMGAKTPRDYAELVQPPIFSYGFYLPTSILILILCIVYSLLPAGFMLLFFGLLYFILGYFTYKYQLLYAMDHPQHATGRAWSMIVNRILIGLVMFQLAMSGWMALEQGFTQAILVLPSILLTIWFSYFYDATYEPLSKFIALRSIRREDDPDINIAGENIGIERPPGHLRRRSTTIDEEREQGQRYVNPSLIVK